MQVLRVRLREVEGFDANSDPGNFCFSVPAPAVLASKLAVVSFSNHQGFLTPAVLNNVTIE
jgi:hypothetical protein